MDEMTKDIVTLIGTQGLSLVLFVALARWVFMVGIPKYFEMYTRRLDEQTERITERLDEQTRAIDEQTNSLDVLAAIFMASNTTGIPSDVFDKKMTLVLAMKTKRRNGGTQ